MKYLTIILAAIMLTGCASEAKIAVSKEVVQNRKLYAKEIVAATNECIKASTSLTHLTAAGNDQEEVVKACTRVAQQAYGAYSPYQEQYLREWAVR